MPRIGSKTITVTDKVYDYHFKIFKKLQKEGSLPPGVTVFGGFVIYLLDNKITDRESLRCFAQNIDQTPISCNQF